MNQNQPDDKYMGRMHDGSLGAHRVRESFNPSKDSMVDKIKRQSADLIDLCEQMKTKDSELNRLCSLAQTHYEDAAMWAVKAATTPK
jgi:hypothetical protein